MAGQTILDGTLQSGPPTVGDTTFPNAVSSLTLRTSPWPKTWACCTGPKSRRLASPSAFVVLDGLGSGHDVQEADLLYFRCDSEVLLRLTFKVGSGTLVSSLYVTGPLTIQCGTTHPLVLAEVEGSATIEYQFEGQV